MAIAAPRPREYAAPTEVKYISDAALARLRAKADLEEMKLSRGIGLVVEQGRLVAS
jgi:hypothetical protein